MNNKSSGGGGIRPRGRPPGSGSKQTLALTRKRKVVTSGQTSSAGTTEHVEEEEEPSFDWSKALSTNKPTKVVPVSSFLHVPFAAAWKEFAVLGSKVEVELLEEGVIKLDKGKPYWIATILQFAGYMTQIRYEGYEDNGKSDKWVNFCTELNPIGYCKKFNLSLIPPLGLPPPPSASDDWRSYLISNLKGSKTVTRNHKKILKLGLKSSIDIGSYHEVLDRTCISQMRIAKVSKIVGRRIQVIYWNAKDLIEDGFWCHESSTAIYPLGWCRAVGHKVDGPYNYDSPLLSAAEIREVIGRADWCRTKIETGMKLEAIDPLNLNQICAATVKQVLQYDYFMIQIDTEEIKSEKDQFCYHISSPLIFQCGFCKTHGITLEPPSDYKSKELFDWEIYFQETKTEPLQIYREQYSTHGFEVGMKLEAVDVMTPSLIAVATVHRIIGRLLRINFDGWDDSFDQWTDAKSLDLFPIGWCAAVGYRLEPPPN